MSDYKEGWFMSGLKKKMELWLPPFLQVLGIFLLNMQLGTGTSYVWAKLIFKIQMFILMNFTNVAAWNAAKLCLTTYHPQKSFAAMPDLSLRVSPLKFIVLFEVHLFIRLSVLNFSCPELVHCDPSIHQSFWFLQHGKTKIILIMQIQMHKRVGRLLMLTVLSD